MKCEKVGLITVNNMKLTVAIPAINYTQFVKFIIGSIIFDRIKFNHNILYENVLQ